MVLTNTFGTIYSETALFDPKNLIKVKLEVSVQTFLKKIPTLNLHDLVSQMAIVCSYGRAPYY